MKAHEFERIPVCIYADDLQAARAVAGRIAELLRNHQAQGRQTVLGLSTGHTPLGVYRELIRLHREESLDLSTAVTFNLDEYWPIDHQSIQSYHAWMDSVFFRHVNIPRENIHLLSGVVEESGIQAECERFEEAIERAGGIDLQLLGIGRTGHVGFNEPGSSSASRTRRIELDRVTRMDAASDFFGEENVPAMALTMGIGTILEAREIILMAFGEHKAPIIRQAVEGPVSDHISASYLQNHPNTIFCLDRAAAAALTRIQTPWMVGSCEWDDPLVRQAVTWLGCRLEKSILKLTDEDYGENGLGELIHRHQGAYNVNLRVFRHLMQTITGWPGGKDGPKRVLILSPHPDDDVICMAGTMARLVQQGHDVHTAYMVSGSLAVFDYDVRRYAGFVRDFNHVFGLAPELSEEIEARVDRALRQKGSCEPDTPEILQIKTLIRANEALAAARYCGLVEQNVHFLDLPFYNTGLVQKNPIQEEDVQRVLALIEQVQPEMIFAAGDMSDPHGTHRQCFDALMQALGRYRAQGNAMPPLWLYRGAWQEWPVSFIDMVVPLSPDEQRRKRYAIFRHESQKDRAMFPGPYDSREFWQRAEDRNRQTAATFNTLGLPDYHALEAFALYPIQPPRQELMQLATVPEADASATAAFQAARPAR